MRTRSLCSRTVSSSRKAATTNWWHAAGFMLNCIASRSKERQCTNKGNQRAHFRVSPAKAQRRQVHERMIYHEGHELTKVREEIIIIRLFSGLRDLRALRGG